MLYYIDMNSSSKTLGNKLKDAREKAKLTQVEVALAADVHVNYYARVERGEVKASFEIVNKIIKALKINPKDIIS